MGDVGGWGAGLQARRVVQGSELGVKVGCSQKGDRSPQGHRDGRQGSDCAFRTSSKNLGRP